MDMLPSAEGGRRLLKYSGPRAIATGVTFPFTVSHGCRPVRMQILPICSNVKVPASTGVAPCIVVPAASRMTDCRPAIGWIKSSTTVRMKSQEQTPEVVTNSRGKVPMRQRECAQRIRMMSPGELFHDCVDSGYCCSAIVVSSHVWERRLDS